MVTGTRSEYSSSTSTTSKISTIHMESILDSLKNKQNRDSTAKNYHQIWTQFNSFIIKLDKMPKSWEQRASLYGAYLVDLGRQSSTIRSYISAIKGVLKSDGYQWDDNKVLLNTITRACKLTNDQLKTRLPIQIGLLELILFQVDRIYHASGQPYLGILFKTLFIFSYYGLFRVGELASSPHTIKASDVHIAENKNKIFIILYSSKTHGKESRPQKVKIVANNNWNKRHFCPFKLARLYMGHRGSYKTSQEPFFIYRDKEGIQIEHVRNLLKQCLTNLNLQSDLYNCQSFRIGAATDLYKNGTSISRIKSLGRWRSNAVYKYLRDF